MLITYKFIFFYAALRVSNRNFFSQTDTPFFTAVFREGNFSVYVDVSKTKFERVVIGK